VGVGESLEYFAPELAARAVLDAAALESVWARAVEARLMAIVLGSGLHGLLLAAQLSSQPDVEVLLVVGEPPVRDRLVGGCTLRSQALAGLADAFLTEPEVLFKSLGGDAAAFHSLALSRAPRGALVLPRRSLSTRTEPPLGLSTRHGYLLSVLRGLLPACDNLVLVAGTGTAPASRPGHVAIDFSGGADATLTIPSDRALVLDATPRSEFETSRSRSIAAVQVPLRVAGGGAPACGADTAWITMTAGDASTQLAFFTPYFDPDSPTATWYGINTAIVDKSGAAGQEEAITRVRERLWGLADVLGFEMVDADRTCGSGVVPFEGGRANPPVRQHGRDDIIDAGSMFGPGAPAMNVDGMLAAVRGINAFAGAIHAGGSTQTRAGRAARAARRALRPLRFRNAGSRFSFLGGPEPSRAAMTMAPEWLWRLVVRDWSRV
jgi:hypothetical protein